MILDADADSSITADTDDRIDLRLGGVDLFRFLGTVASAVNGVDFTGTATGVAPSIEVVGSDTNIDFDVKAKGTGSLTFSVGNSGIVLTSRIFN